MGDIQLAAVVAAIVSASLQALKDHLNLKPETLRWVAAVLGAVAGGSAGYIGGGDTVGQVVTNTGLGAVLVTGYHSLLLHDSVLGRTLKAIGEALFKK